MDEIRKKLIDKSFVHKEKNENVLIYNVRRSLPVKIEQKVLNDIVLPVLTEEEKKIILDYYILHNNGTTEDEPEFYIMYNIPHVIEIDYVINTIVDNKLSKDEARELLKYYVKDSQKQHYVLKKDLTEIDEIEIQNLLKKKDLQLLDYDEREKLANIFEKIKDFEKEDVFYANMFADREHLFFFEHSIEHVPAMMMIEASRQMLIAICHLYGNISMDEISFIISNMNVSFLSYLELNFPIKMITKVNKVKKRSDGSWKSSIDVDVNFYQNNIKAAIINYKGRIISKEGFSELRKVRKRFKEQPRFVPNDMIYKSIALKDFKNSNYTCRLNDISEAGFQLELNEPIIKLEYNKFSFVTFFQDIGFINGECELKWHKEKSGGYKGGFSITYINPDDLNGLKEGIKRYCFLRTNREYL